MWSTVKLFLGLRPRSWVEIAGLVGLMLLVTATYVGQGLMIADLLSTVFSSADIAGLAAPLVVIGVLQVLRIALIVARDSWAPRVSARVKGAVREGLTLKLMEIGPGQAQRMRTGDLQSTLVDSVELLDPLLSRFVPSVLASVLGSCLASMYVIAVDPVVGLVVLACALLAPLSKLAGEKSIRERGSRWTVSYRSMYSESLDAVQGMATLKAFNASGRRGRELIERGEAFCRDSIGLMVAWCGTSSIGALMVPIGTTAAVGLGAWHAATGSVSVAGLFTILMLTRETFRPMTELEAAYHSAYYAIPAGRAVADVLNLEPVVKDTATTAPEWPCDPPGLEFRDLRFCYPTRRAPALDGFNLVITPGERVAIVGRSGAGKSTIIGLLMRYFDTDAGSIRINDRDIRELALRNLRSMIGVVSQDTYLFHGTVRDNLLLARPDATDEEIRRAVTAAQAADFITLLPQGLDTVVGERGLKLSGGERQRIAIARALLKDAPVLVLDEPTSSIDAANEAEITQALGDLTLGRTTIIIAHRLSTVRGADRIVVMESGRVVEFGSHPDLVARKGLYAELVATQAGALA
ncbi:MULTISPECIES: ABC transporter ATP-binding protein [unclassified Micromonospora]|uniref:ABC transporter ATP-binding protein n=1 Tax=unclassified Micromonospora TaxID=2617518 RepID=UPI0022B64C19|nr:MULTISPECIES: ABC transporter ATP-binding protein [unclassified Micromonospora]MCZ7418657.1 ABC transporter ATP-binding protein [Verrucosispora sp. WMMA2121]WBB92359.1 ABC transporter ATP-binding protein [Verrucosispora sp. WMMC514]